MLKHLPRPTKTNRTEAYDAISPLRREPSLKGKTVLITGGATGIGFETSKAFAQAGTARLVLVASSQSLMTEAKKDIEDAFPETKVDSFAVSFTDTKRIDEVVNEVGKTDILVMNAGTMPRPSPVLDTRPEDLETTFATNTSTAGVTSPKPGTSIYNSSKIVMTFLMRCIDAKYGPTGLRTFTFHPSIAYTPMARDALGLKEVSAPYDNSGTSECLPVVYLHVRLTRHRNLPAQFAVWLCSPEADFLKGRFLWAMWDVEELEAKKAAIEASPDALKVGLMLDGLME